MGPGSMTSQLTVGYWTMKTLQSADCYDDQEADIITDIIRDNPEELTESLVNLCRNLVEQNANEREYRLTAENIDLEVLLSRGDVAVAGQPIIQHQSVLAGLQPVTLIPTTLDVHRSAGQLDQSHDNMYDSSSSLPVESPSLSSASSSSLYEMAPLDVVLQQQQQQQQQQHSYMNGTIHAASVPTVTSYSHYEQQLLDSIDDDFDWDKLL